MTLPPPQQGKQQSSLAVPVSIVIAGALVAFAVYSSDSSSSNKNAALNNDAGANVAAAIEVKDVQPSDHLLGNPGAPVKIIEYSDTECPFCKRFHATLQQVMQEYGAKGEVAWAYRHLPLTSIHPKAFKEAVATECAAKLGGNEKFWAYLDRIFEITPANNGLDHALLPQIAQQIGLDKGSFEACLASNEFDAAITASMEEAEKAGASGTPYSIVISPKGKKIPVNGALPYSEVKKAIETALADK